MRAGIRTPIDALDKTGRLHRVDVFTGDAVVNPYEVLDRVGRSSRKTCAAPRVAAQDKIRGSNTQSLIAGFRPLAPIDCENVPGFCSLLRPLCLCRVFIENGCDTPRIGPINLIAHDPPRRGRWMPALTAAFTILSIW
jgi:hypothetical protein